MIQMNNISKVYCDEMTETHALVDVSLSIERGEFVAIMGPSGCGKSSLLNIIGLLDDPTSGSYLLNGVEMSSVNEHGRLRYRKGRIGFVFQAFNLIEELTVEENIDLALCNLSLSRSERHQRVAEAMDKVHISHRATHYPSQLSGGQQQRVAIARAVVSHPELILADEPTGNLDSRNGQDVMDLLTDLRNSGTTIVMVTHSPKDAAYADRIIDLFDGRVVQGLKVR